MGESGGVQSIDRMLDIVERLSEMPQGMALSELAADVGLHVSTVHRLLKSLAERGYAYRDGGSGKYRLTLRLFEIGSRVSGTLQLLNAARPGLDDLADFTQEAVHLVVRDGDEVLYLYKAEPFRQSVRMSSCVGHRNAMYCTGVGKSILSFLPGQEVEEIWQRTAVVAHTPHTRTSLTQLTEDLEQVRKLGYAWDREEHESGVCCVAVPILNWENQPVAAVSVSAPVARMQEADRERVLPRLRQLGEELSRQMGRKGQKS